MLDEVFTCFLSFFLKRLLVRVKEGIAERWNFGTLSAAVLKWRKSCVQAVRVVSDERALHTSFFL